MSGKLSSPSSGGPASGGPVSVDSAHGAPRPRYRAFSLERVGAMVLRYVYVLRSSWPRLLELMYWPLLQLLTWGFLQEYLSQQSSGPGGTSAVGTTGRVLLGSVLLWEVLVRGQLGFNMSFLEEMWSRNMANLLISPLSRLELVLSMLTMSLLRMLVSIVPITVLAIFFFDYNLWSLGVGLGAFFVNLLMTGWALAILTSGLLLRNGMGAEGLVWSMMFLLMPLCCVFYPVSVLPPFLQRVAWALPPTYVFEGMRVLSTQQLFRWDLMLQALAINVVLLSLAAVAFSKLVDSARRAGSLMSIGE
jgi:ABC-2 type transport system permease protein